MQREENKIVTHPLKKRRARGSLVVIWHVGCFVGKCKVLERETTRSPANYVGTEKGCSCPFCYEPSSHVSSSSASSARARIQIACPAMTTMCLSNEVPTIPRYCDEVEW